MQDLDFQQIPTNYRKLFNSIYNKTIQKLYYKPDFKYLFISLREIQSNYKYTYSFKSLLLNFLKTYHFITFQFSKICNDIQNLKNLSSKNIDIIFVVEDACIIIEQVDKNFTCEIIDEIKKLEKKAIINTSTSINIIPNSIEEDEVKEEIDNFLVNFQFEINNNLFVKNTIRSIAGFLIRKFFYPTNYFKDPSFFHFNGKSYSNEPKMQKYFSDFLFSETDTILINAKIQEECISNQRTIFKKTDFIKLRVFTVNEFASFYLAIHIESLFIFLLKEINSTDNKFDEIQHEINFCSNYSHRCMTHFYGFMKKGSAIIGFVYEFLSNGPLSSYLLKRKKTNDIFQLTLIIRLFECLKYLRKQSLIHRDIKPENILLNHDFIPFISDFETIRRPLSQNESIEMNSMSSDIGTFPYLSPE